MYDTGPIDPVTDSKQVKSALAALADGEARASSPAERDARTAGERPEATGPATDYRTVIERAVAATDDLDAAASFVESVGLDGLERAVERAEREVSGLAADGREALATFERFRVAAQGPVEE